MDQADATSPYKYLQSANGNLYIGSAIRSAGLPSGYTDQAVITSSGSLGLGTNNPITYSKLDIRGGALNVVNYTTNGYGYIGRNADPGNNDSYLYHVISTNYHIIGSGKNGTGAIKKLGFALGSTDTESDIKMTIDNNGGVGIGTSYIPSAFKLAVNGKIICEEVNVKLRVNWPDYVFSSQHKKLSLPELEDYININKHLPNILSADDINEKGLNMSEMQVKQMEKIEELTIYIIELNKEIQHLKKENETMKKKRKECYKN